MRSLCPRIAVLALLALGGLCRGQQHRDPFGTAEQDFEPDPGPARTVGVQVEFIEVSHQQLLDLLYGGEPPAADATPLRKKLQAMVQSGQAKLIETTMVSARAGIQATVESHAESIYPTEYEPWEVPREVDPPGTPQRFTPEDRRRMEAMVAPSAPTSFETRNLGASLEVRPHAGEGFVDLELQASLTWLGGHTRMGERKDSAGNVDKVELPAVYRMQMTTALSCPVGRQVLAGALSPKDDQGATDPSRKVMVFVKCGLRDIKPVMTPDVLASVHVLEMPQSDAAGLAAEYADDNAMFRKSRELVKSGRAKLFETSVMRASPEKQAGIESVLIRITPYESAGAVGCTALGAEPAKDPPPPAPPPQIRFPNLTTSFEARNVGNSCELTPYLIRGQMIVSGNWSFELYPGDTVSMDWTDALGNRHQCRLPAYLSFKSSFSRELVSGKWQLVSVQNSSDAKGKIDPSRKLVVFLRADNLAPQAPK